MPFIRGRYHMNPIAGQALEAAREAEAARLAEADQQGQGNAQSSGADDYENRNAESADQGAIHRVEIEAAEMVPSHSGRAERGFVARVHRRTPGNPAANSPRGEFPSSAHAARAETHVFSNHQDLIDFLHHEFSKDCNGK
ncbi:MAG TPA: hypothetical protein VEX69_06580 [Candidatus Limnocylindria bacterium]|nr:hypothetical protein [Candidatus Limnocylindria bacterium]